jgi:hypothetical protein
MAALLLSPVYDEHDDLHNQALETEPRIISCEFGGPRGHHKQKVLGVQLARKVGIALE